MGWSAEDTERCSLWQINTMIDGWLQSKGVDQKPDMLTDDMIEEFEQMAVAGHG